MSLDLQLENLRCPTVAVGGTNGKSTTCSLLERMLAHNHRRVVRCGEDALPVSSVPNQGADLDFIVLSVDPFELQQVRQLRPAVAVLLNLWPDHLASTPSRTIVFAPSLVFSATSNILIGP